MPFDEELQRTIDSLTERLRADITRELQAAGAALAAQAQSERNEAIQAAVAEARAEAAVAADARLHAALAEARHAAEAILETAVAQAEACGRAEGRESARSGDLAASDRLLDAVRALDRTESLSEILDTLARCAGREAARVAVILARGAELRGWRFLGFPQEIEAATVIAREESGVIGEALRTAAPASADTCGVLSAPAFAALAGGRQCLAVPVIMSGEVVAVLYADQGTADQPGARPSSLTWPDAVELMARHAARCLEATTALKAVRVLGERPAGSAGRAASTVQTDAPNADAGEEGARRYARLLVSEIKLYHEGAVAEGRRARDLASRLGIEIARARVLYEQKIPSHLRADRDHFHDELVQTLANGDESLLGQTA